MNRICNQRDGTQNSMCLIISEGGNLKVNL